MNRVGLNNSVVLASPAADPGAVVQRGSAGSKPFRLVKYVAISSLVVIVVSTVFLSSFLSHRAKKILLAKSEQYAFLVAENLNHQVFFQFTLPTLISEGEIRLSRKNQYERLDKVVRNTIHGFAIERVDIYDPQQILTYSTEQEKIGSKGTLGDRFDRAFRGQSFSVIEGTDRSILGISWHVGPQKLKTYLPMWVERPMSWKRGKVLGVFEITQDVTADYENIRRFQLIIFSSIMIFVGVLFAALLAIVHRAEQILEARARERKKLEDELHQAERLAALGEMIAGISHEIKNPLGIIRSTAELMEKRANDERQKKLSSIIVEEATRLNNIVTEFLDFARPKTLQTSECRVEDVLDRNLEILQAECQSRGIQVERDYRTGGYTLESDPNLLYRAFLNLFSNAVQAMNGGGTLRVSTSLVMTDGRSDPCLEVRIEDSGPGIPEEIRTKIFNPFFTTRERGTGLGLSIVQTIIQSHHGSVVLEPGARGGTAAVVRLPLRQPKEEEKE